MGLKGSNQVGKVISEEINPAGRRPRDRPPVTWLQRIDFLGREGVCMAYIMHRPLEMHRSTIYACTYALVIINFDTNERVLR